MDDNEGLEKEDENINEDDETTNMIERIGSILRFTTALVLTKGKDVSNAIWGSKKKIAIVVLVATVSKVLSWPTFNFKFNIFRRFRFKIKEYKIKEKKERRKKLKRVGLMASVATDSTSAKKNLRGKRRQTATIQLRF